MKQVLIAIAVGFALTACSSPAPEPEQAAQPTAEATPQVDVATEEPDTSVVEEAAPVMAAASANASIRMLRATCPGGIGLQTAAGGPVRINGEDASVKVTSPDYYEATDAASGVTVVVATNPDGSQSVSYTGKARAHGMCTVDAAAPTQGRIALLNASCPGGVEFHADEGGSVYINGKNARLDIRSLTYYEAQDAATLFSISVSTDSNGVPSVTYTDKAGETGVCEVKG